MYLITGLVVGLNNGYACCSDFFVLKFWTTHWCSSLNCCLLSILFINHLYLFSTLLPKSRSLFICNLILDLLPWYLLFYFLIFWMFQNLNCHVPLAETSFPFREAIVPRFWCNFKYTGDWAGRFLIFFSSFNYFKIKFQHLDKVQFQFMQGWRLVSPHFTTLLESAIFPALVMNDKVRIYLKYNMHICFA